jgi:hypothetical protein
MSRNNRQLNFVDEMANRENRRNRSARFLDRLGAVVDFAPIGAGVTLDLQLIGIRRRIALPVLADPREE